MSVRGDVTFAGNSTVLSVHEQRETQEQIHKALHRNLYLLSLHYPMKKDLKGCFEEGMLKSPNSLAFNQLAYYLMSIIDPKCITPNLSYLICETKMAAQFRKEFLKFVTVVSNTHKGYISPIMPSWIVTAGGYKVAKLIFELSQVALKTYILQTNPPKNADDISILNGENCLLINIDEKICDYKKELVDKMSLWYSYSKNMERVYDLYREQSELIKKSIESNTKILTDLVNSIKETVSNDEKEYLEDTFHLDSPDFINTWDERLQERTVSAEKKWENISNNVLLKSRSSKNTCHEIIQRYTRQSNDDITLKHNPETKILISHLTSDDNTSDKIIVKNDILHLPNLFMAYNAMLFQGFKMFAFFKIDRKFFSEVLNKKIIIKSKYDDAKQINVDVSNLYEKLKENRQMQIIPYKKSVENEWIYQAFNVPRMDPSILDCFKFMDQY